MEISATMVSELRKKSGAGVMDCKKALVETKGDVNKALELLRKKGKAEASKRVMRKAQEGLIASYIHFGGKIGVLVEVNCETDFVARTDEFKELVKDITMQIAAMNPAYISPEDVPPEILEKEKEIYRSQYPDRPSPVVEKIIEGKLKKFFAQNCLLEQPFVKNGDISVREYMAEKISKLGENIRVRRFVRYQLGEEV